MVKNARFYNEDGEALKKKVTVKHIMQENLSRTIKQNLIGYAGDEKNGKKNMMNFSYTSLL